ncbi:hypothetical protein [Bradyrhizobium sp. ISRA426]|uniref:hypothetical protein n=1 Tax=Bradyrhizobium sp. ISRA426 TaxID=2866191 RepID=UPI00247A356D|nr:hypothetical protein [Bradyrhizobium sp. ISRA426]WGR70335.1 hypothetical protein MTX24_33950 [Bradyrhizobium sp. ISRA426]
MTSEISSTLADNAAIEGMTTALTEQWGSLHIGNYLADPEQFVDFSRLSDGQQSILYLSIVLGMHDIGAKVLSGELAEAFDIDKLRLAIFTMIAIEEPENSLSPLSRARRQGYGAARDRSGRSGVACDTFAFVDASCAA